MTPAAAIAAALMISCPCGCGKTTIDARTTELISEIVHFFSPRPVVIHAVFRCSAAAEPNADSGGYSQHEFGRAVDFHVDRIDHATAFDMIHAARASGHFKKVHALFKHSWGLHADVHPRQTRPAILSGNID